VILNPFPRRTSYYVTARQVERTIEELGREIGFSGDCFAEVPQLGTPEQEADFRAFYGALPYELKRIAGPLARRMARSFAFTATPIEEPGREGRWA
jgi:hypothetical protein